MVSKSGDGSDRFDDHQLRYRWQGFPSRKRKLTNHDQGSFSHSTTWRGGPETDACIGHLSKSNRKGHRDERSHSGCSKGTVFSVGPIAQLYRQEGCDGYGDLEAWIGCLGIPKPKQRIPPELVRETLADFRRAFSG